MKNNLDIKLLQSLADNNGTIHKQKLFYYFQKDTQQYRQAVNRLTIKGLIEEKKAVFKLTPEGYEFLNPKKKWTLNNKLTVWTIIVSILSITVSILIAVLL